MEVCADLAGELPRQVFALERARPGMALLEVLEKDYFKGKSPEPGRYLHRFLVAGASDFQGHGIAKSLVQIALENGKALGYRTAITETTGLESQHRCRQNGFKDHNHVVYKEFVFEGRLPFETIKEAPSIILQALELTA